MLNDEKPVRETATTNVFFSLIFDIVYYYHSSGD